MYEVGEKEPHRLHGWSVLTAAAVKRPCLKAFVLPTGAPGDAPPCIRQRPFVIAGDRHGIPLLVRAPIIEIEAKAAIRNAIWRRAIAAGPKTRLRIPLCRRRAGAYRRLV